MKQTFLKTPRIIDHSIASYKVNTVQMEAFNRFTKCIFKWERFLLKLVGQNILDVQPKRTSMTYAIYITIIVSIVMEVYTFIFYGLIEKMFCLHAMTFTFQVR